MSLTGTPSTVTRAPRGSSTTGTASQLRRDLPGRSPNQRAQPREHFFDLKRLGDVVVRAAVDALDLLVPAAARRQHQHRHREAGVAPLPQHREAVDLRQAEVEDHRVVALGSSQELAALAVGGVIHGIARLAQRAAKLLSQLEFVFDDQDAHALLLFTLRD